MKEYIEVNGMLIFTAHIIKVTSYVDQRKVDILLVTKETIEMHNTNIDQFKQLLKPTLRS